jgi:catechol 2,3-dioxygenase-like lactoylglutathione lyase family enzyme
MSVRIGSTVVNCADLETMTEFWTQALGLTPSSRLPTDDFRVLRGDRVNMSLQVAETPVTGRHQMHLDLYSDDTDAQVDRLLDLGARYVRRNEQDDYVVLLDPEGNEFCVCTVPTDLMS